MTLPCYLGAGLVHIAFSYLVRDGQKIRKDTKTHQERHLAIDAVTAAVLADRKQQVQVLLDTTYVKLPPTAYVSPAIRSASRPGIRTG